VRIAVTADLHWGTNAAGDAATRLLVADLAADPPDVLLLAGDVGAAHEFEPCLALFDGLDCRKALVPGNHDVWVVPDDPRGDSLAVYHRHLPAACAAHGFHYLDHGPLVLADAGLAVAGSMNWYDYSWADPAALAAAFPDWLDRLRTKRFVRGRHNDARFVRWVCDDVGFTAVAVSVFEKHLAAAEAAAESVLVVTHHPPFRGLNFQRSGPPTPDGLLWDAFAGNRALEDLLARHAGRVPWTFCGHTHRARAGTLAGIQGRNVGSDYPFKRLLTLDWPAGTLTEREYDVRGA
jgi:3',5'-cyclic AMP phosphodiesterase CpdA